MVEESANYSEEKLDRPFRALRRSWDSSMRTIDNIWSFEALSFHDLCGPAPTLESAG